MGGFTGRGIYFPYPARKREDLYIFTSLWSNNISRMEVSLSYVLYRKLELCKCVNAFICEVTRGALIDCRCLFNQQRVTNNCGQGTCKLN